MRLYTVLLYFLQTALHVSDDALIHHQDHTQNVITSGTGRTVLRTVRWRGGVSDATSADGSSRFLRNIGAHLSNYTESHSGIPSCSSWIVFMYTHVSKRRDTYTYRMQIHKWRNLYLKERNSIVRFIFLGITITVKSEANIGLIIIYVRYEAFQIQLGKWNLSSIPFESINIAYACFCNSCCFA
jgi:hypothetical protein